MHDVTNIEPSYPNDFVDVLLVFDQDLPPEGTLQDRGDVHEYLVGQARRSKEQIVTWLTRLHLWDEVRDLGEPNSFSMIPCTCSRRVAALIADAPGVEAVVPDHMPLSFTE